MPLTDAQGIQSLRPHKPSQRSVRKPHARRGRTIPIQIWMPLTDAQGIQSLCRPKHSSEARRGRHADHPAGVLDKWHAKCRASDQRKGVTYTPTWRAKGTTLRRSTRPTVNTTEPARAGRKESVWEGVATWNTLRTGAKQNPRRAREAVGDTKEFYKARKATQAGRAELADK